jgi:formylglycine-generating enzyme required for sulfatase activity
MGSPSSEPGRSNSEGPQRKVTIGHPFAVGKFEVTRDQFERFVRETDRPFPYSCTWIKIGSEQELQPTWSFRFPGYFQEGNHPVVCVNWYEAKAFVAWLSKKTGKEYSLLSEAEWEYAARAGSQSRYYFGDDERFLCKFGNVADITDPSQLAVRPLVECRDGYVRTAPVGKFAANAWGLHDTIGNAWEWVEDCWNDSYSGAPDNGSPWLKGNCSIRVARGGSWGSIALNNRSATRSSRFNADMRAYHLSFRVARRITP